MADREVQFVTKVFKALQDCDQQAFDALVGSQEAPRWTPSQKAAILEAQHYEDENNTVAHKLLTSKNRWSFLLRWLREGEAYYFWLFLSKEFQNDQQFVMLQRFFQERGFARTIELANSQGDKPLHVAVANNADTIVEKLLDAGADLTAVDGQGRTPIELAAALGKHHIYEKILARSQENAKQGNLKNSYTLEQLRAAKRAYSENLNSKKNKAMKVLGTIMSIACPVGAVLAFCEWPLLEVFFTMFLGAAGIFVGLAGAVVMAGLLYWTFHTKAEKKFGEHAQKVLDLKSALSQVAHLKAQLKDVLKLEAEKGPSDELDSQKNSIIHALDTIYAQKIPEGFKKKERPSSTSWASATDVIQTYTSVAGGFLCAFSGMLGILGAFASYIPQTALLSAVCLGVPVAGWCALAIALSVCAVGLWVYSSKIQKALEEKGESRKKVYNLEEKLFNNCAASKNEHKQIKEAIAARTSGLVTEQRQSLKPDERTTRQVGFRSSSSSASTYEHGLSPAELLVARGGLGLAAGHAPAEVRSHAVQPPPLANNLGLAH